MESLHPDDICTLDTSEISYITLKNGNMILIDASTPQKNKNVVSNSNIQTHNQKEILLEISSNESIYFKGNKSNNHKSDFTNCSKIRKIENFWIFGKRVFNPIENLRNKNFKNLNELSKDNFCYFYSQQNKLDEQFKESKTNINNNDGDFNYSKIEKYENQSNINTNLSIPVVNFTQDKKAQLSNININNNNSNEDLTKRRSSRLSKGYIGDGLKMNKRCRNTINAVCSLNIRAEEKYKINLINQFNSIVDKLNEQRDKTNKHNIFENDKDNKDFKYYKFYKSKMNKKDIYGNRLGIDIGVEQNNQLDKSNNYLCVSKYSMNKENNMLISNTTNGNINQKENSFMSTIRLSSTKADISNFRYKIRRYSSSNLVLPSNKILLI